MKGLPQKLPCIQRVLLIKACWHTTIHECLAVSTPQTNHVAFTVAELASLNNRIPNLIIFRDPPSSISCWLLEVVQTRSYNCKCQLYSKITLKESCKSERTNSPPLAFRGPPEVLATPELLLWGTMPLI